MTASITAPDNDRDGDSDDRPPPARFAFDRHTWMEIA